jgi:hypothetical protein
VFPPRPRRSQCGYGNQANTDTLRHAKLQQTDKAAVEILWSILQHRKSKQEVAMKRFIISIFIVGLLSLSLSPAFASPSDHDLKTEKGVKGLFDEIQQKSAGQ